MRMEPNQNTQRLPLTGAQCHEPHGTHQLWHSMVASCPGHSSWVPLSPLSPQRHCAVGTHSPSCSSCPCGQRHPAGQEGGMGAVSTWQDGHRVQWVGGPYLACSPPARTPRAARGRRRRGGSCWRRWWRIPFPASHSPPLCTAAWCQPPSGWGSQGGGDGGLPGHTAVLQLSLWVCAPWHCPLPARRWRWRCRRRKLPLQGCWQGPHGPQGLQRHSSMGCWCHSEGDTGVPSPPCPAALWYLGRCRGLGRAAAAAAQLSTQLCLQTRAGRSVGPGRLGSGAAPTRGVWCPPGGMGTGAGRCCKASTPTRGSVGAALWGHGTAVWVGDTGMSHGWGTRTWHLQNSSHRAWGCGIASTVEDMGHGDVALQAQWKPWGRRGMHSPWQPSLLHCRAPSWHTL